MPKPTAITAISPSSPTGMSTGRTTRSLNSCLMTSTPWCRGLARQRGELGGPVRHLLGGGPTEEHDGDHGAQQDARAELHDESGQLHVVHRGQDPQAGEVAVAVVDGAVAEDEE